MFTKINQNSNRHIVIFSLLGSPSGESFLVLNNLRYFRCFERSDAYICVDKRWKCVLCSMFAPGSNVIFIDKTIFTHILYSATFFIDSRRCTIYQFFPRHITLNRINWLNQRAFITQIILLESWRFQDCIYQLQSFLRMILFNLNQWPIALKSIYLDLLLFARKPTPVRKAQILFGRWFVVF